MQTVQQLRIELLEFFRGQREFFAEVTSEEIAPYFDDQVNALIRETKQVVDRCIAVCEREDASREDLRNSFAEFKPAFERSLSAAMPWVERFNRPN